MAEQTFVVSQPPRLQQVSQIYGEPRGFQKLTVSNVAVALTIPKNANCAFVVVENSSVRWRDDAVDPDGDTGMLFFAGNLIQINSAKQLAQFKAIRETSQTSDATLNISYYEK